MRLILAMLLLLSIPALAQQPIYPGPTRWVTVRGRIGSQYVIDINTNQVISDLLSNGFCTNCVTGTNAPLASLTCTDVVNPLASCCSTGVCCTTADLCATASKTDNNQGVGYAGGNWQQQSAMPNYGILSNFTFEYWMTATLTTNQINLSNMFSDLETHLG